MRYQEGTESELPRSGVDQGMLVGTVSYSLLLGIAMVVVGLAARQRGLPDRDAVQRGLTRTSSAI